MPENATGDTGQPAESYDTPRIITFLTLLHIDIINTPSPRLSSSVREEHSNLLWLVLNIKAVTIKIHIICSLVHIVWFTLVCIREEVSS